MQTQHSIAHQRHNYFTYTNNMCIAFNCRPSGERGFRNARNRHLRSRYCCSVYPAVRNNYRALLRSSSIREPSDPPHGVIISYYQLTFHCILCFCYVCFTSTINEQIDTSLALRKGDTNWCLMMSLRPVAMSEQRLLPYHG